MIYSVPNEIDARGPRAKLAYENALKTGKVKVYRARIMLMGQDRAGKTSLKKSFLGLPFDPEEESTDGIKVYPSKFEVDIDQVKNWKHTNEKLGVSQFSFDLAKMVARDLQEIDDEAEEEGNMPKNDEENEIEEKRDISLVQVNPCRKSKSGCKCRAAHGGHKNCGLSNFQLTVSNGTRNALEKRNRFVLDPSVYASVSTHKLWETLLWCSQNLAI